MPLRSLRAAGALATVLTCALIGGGRTARAGDNDPSLVGLCEPRAQSGLSGGTVTECGWVQRQPGTGLVTGAGPDAAAQSRFRSLASELGVVMAPRLVVPAETIGYAGFQLSMELGITSISRDEAFWNGVEGVSPQNPTASRPSSWLTTVGGYVRKGVWLGLPAFELGAGAVHLVDSHLMSWQAYAKLALFEGYPTWPLPSLAIRGAAAYVTGSDQLKPRIFSVDALLSKPFGIKGTFRLEPFAGASLLYISAVSGVMDLTPACDAFATQTAAPGTPLGPGCAAAQRGTANDFLADASFPEQSRITRQRYFAGAKVRLAPVFLTAQYEIVPHGRSRDKKRPNGARDESADQRTISLSAGLDF